MPQLYKGLSAWNLADISPFSLKVMVWLDLKEISYKIRNERPDKGPKGKIPWFIDDDGTTIADSSDIVDYLISKHGPLPGDAHIPHNQGTGHLIRRTFEESLYFCSMANRWLEDEHFSILEGVFAKALPPVLGPIIFRNIVRKNVRKATHAQGIGRHATADIHRRAIEDLRAISDFLSEKPYFCGNQPGTLDATAWGFLAQAIHAPFGGPMIDFVKHEKRLVDYVERLKPRLSTAWRPSKET